MNEGREPIEQLGHLTHLLKGMLESESPEKKQAQQIIHSLNEELKGLTIHKRIQPYDQVKLSRHPKRPTGFELISSVFDHFTELHGDRCYSDDAAIVTGIARLGDIPVTVIAHQKGRNLEENLKCNFGMANPEGYRKAKRVMKQAERFGRPVISLIDTPGAYPGIGAEERGQALAIAENLYLMSRLQVPIIAVITGEGGSGGALGVGLADRLLMFENAIYSVISPEGCAAILWKDAKKADEAAVALKLTATDLLGMGIADQMIKEPTEGAHADPHQAARALQDALIETTLELLAIPLHRLLAERTTKYRKIGVM